MFDSKSASRSSAAKKTGSFRYATRLLSLDKGKRTNQGKEAASLKACETLLKSDEWKGSKHAQGTKFPAKKVNVNKNLAVKDVKNKASSTNRHEKVVIVSKRSASVSVVKSSSMRRSVSVRKVSYSTSVLLSSEDSDSDEDSDDDKEEEYNGRRKTVVKQTTSKIKNYSESKSSDNGSSKKSKAIKLLREKLAPIKRKSNPPARELRPRFPYSPTHEWPTARAHRMASLNALAKVHVLYENEGRNINESGNDGDDICVIDLLNDESEDEKVIIKREVKSPVNVKSKIDKPKNKNINKDKNESKVASKEKNESKTTSKEKNESKIASKEKNESKTISKEKNESKVVSKEKNESKTVSKEKNESSKTAVSKPKVLRKTRKRKLADVEIIDTKHCKRMACLNAQAILAASYMQEKPKKLAPKKPEKCETLSDIDVNEVVLETKCDIKILGGEKNMHVESESSTNIRSETREEFKREKKKAEPRNSYSMKMPSVKLSQQNEDIKPASPAILLEKSQKQMGSTIVDTSSNSSMLTTTASKVTQYTEVTKVHINTRKKVEIKEEAKTEKQMHENDDVAITQMYHYQSKNVNESYSLQMQASYKPPSKNATSHPSNASSSNHQLPSNMKESLPGRPNFYNNPPPNSVLPRKPYHMNQPINRIPSVMKIDHRFSRQYGGSAFTVPHYGHPQNIPYPHNDYGYYQPAGPMIQPIHDQCPILKPVPFHPQPHLQQQQMTASAPPPNMDPRYPHLDDNIKKMNKSLPSPSHIATPQQSTQIPQSNMPVLNKRISVPHGMLSTIDCPQPPIHPGNLQNARKQPSSTELIPSYTPQNNPMGDYLPQHPNPQGYPNSYEQKTYPPKQQHLDPSATNYVYHHEEKFCQNPNSQLLSQDSILDTSSPKHSSIIMHQMFASHPEAKKPLWQDTSKPEAPVSSVMFNPYVNESTNKDPSLVQVSENVTYPTRPPSVIEITEESSRDIKTYIQLEVPQSRFREKIVVVDVESDECVANDDDIQNIESIKMDSFLHSQEKVCETSDLETVDVDAVEIDLHEQEEYFSNKSEINIKDSPDIMVIEVKKHKESAVVRRARLNGKQRTFRDCYNRPLAPLVKAKKKDGLSVDLSENQLMQPTISLPRLILPKLLEKSFSHGWSWEGTPFEKLIFISNDEPACIRQCYSSMRHHEGDIIKVRDCVLLRSGLRKTDLPFVAKVTALWENPDNGEMTMSLLWYYRPEHTEHGKKSNHMDDEIFASKHKDINSVACIEDKCYVLTFGEYCRYKRQFRFNEAGYRPLASVVPEPEEYPRTNCLPPTNISPDMIFFCRKVYDYRQKRLLKNPT